MPLAPRKLSEAFLTAKTCLLTSLLMLLAVIPMGRLRAAAAQSAAAATMPAIFPLAQVQPGMKGEAYTIFEGDTIEKMDLSVIGVLHNALGPKQDVILVELHGEKVEHTGVVAGMSGSPVYIDGKLVGALSLKLGVFTKEAIGGVTPIEEMLDTAPPAEAAPANAGKSGAGSLDTGRAGTELSSATESSGGTSGWQGARVPLTGEFAERTGAGAGQYLEPIETPLIATGLYPETMEQFGKQISSWGMTMTPGGTAAASAEDKDLKPGDMVGVELMRGDLSLAPGCTVTAIDDGRVFACGHPIFGFGRVAMPLTRGHVLLTLASSMASTKIMETGGVIGTLTEDHATAIMGKLGAGPAMIPVELTYETPVAEKTYHFEVIENRQLTPTLVALAVFNGVVSNPKYGEGSTLKLEGTIEMKGHTSVRLQDLYPPTEQAIPTGFSVAGAVQSAFMTVYSNPYEPPEVSSVHVKVTALPERRSATIDNAWIEKSEVRPGETVSAKVLLRPYRGAPFVQEIPITIPPQAAAGPMQLVISDAATLNRSTEAMAASSEGRLPGLEELINLLNRSRRNDRLYATLLQSSPTLLIEDKEMPNAPTSAINVLDQRQNPGGARLLFQSRAGEWSVEMDQAIEGERMLTITVK
ncbi:MAG: SpoIVB peptidase S55 domain-containing protein [Candidatus Acidiferrales bacterium]